MADRRRQNVNWAVADEAGTTHNSIKDGVMLAVLMDLRDALHITISQLREQNTVLRRMDRRLKTHAPLPKGRA